MNSQVILCMWIVIIDCFLFLLSKLVHVLLLKISVPFLGVGLKYEVYLVLKRKVYLCNYTVLSVYWSGLLYGVKKDKWSWISWIVKQSFLNFLHTCNWSWISWIVKQSFLNFLHTCNWKSIMKLKYSFFILFLILEQRTYFWVSTEVDCVWWQERQVILNFFNSESVFLVLVYPKKFLHTCNWNSIMNLKDFSFILLLKEEHICVIQLTVRIKVGGFWAQPDGQWALSNRIERIFLGEGCDVVPCVNKKKTKY